MLPQDAVLYINEKEGVDRLQGNTKIYHKLLASFVGKNMLTAVEEAISAGDIPTAAEAAHALKGTSANLAMAPLFDASSAMEKKLKAGESYDAELERLRLVYSKTADAVRDITGA